MPSCPWSYLLPPGCSKSHTMVDVSTRSFLFFWGIRKQGWASLTPRYAIKEEWEGELPFSVSGWGTEAPATSTNSPFNFIHLSTIPHSWFPSFICGLLQKLASSHPPSSILGWLPIPVPPPPFLLLAGLAQPVQVPQRGCLGTVSWYLVGLGPHQAARLLQLVFREYFGLEWELETLAWPWESEGFTICRANLDNFEHVKARYQDLRVLNEQLPQVGFIPG